MMGVSSKYIGSLDVHYMLYINGAVEDSSNRRSAPFIYAYKGHLVISAAHNSHPIHIAAHFITGIGKSITSIFALYTKGSCNAKYFFLKEIALWI